MDIVIANIHPRPDPRPSRGREIIGSRPSCFACLGDVPDTPPEMRLRTFFEEGFGIVGGFFGTYIGALTGKALVVPAAKMLLTFFGIALGPWGIVIIVAVCAAGAGLALSGGGKWLVGKTYDIRDQFSGRVYHSMDELIGAF